MSCAVREDDHILIRTGDQTWREIDDDLARQYLHDLTDSLLHGFSGDKSIRAVRKRKGLTQEEVAEMAGISRVYLSTIERGHADVTLRTARKLCAVLGCELNTIPVS